MKATTPRVCKLDGVPISLHAKCFRCTVLAGPGHAGTLIWGMCSSCRRSLAAATSEAGWTFGGGRDDSDQAANPPERVRSAGYMTARDVAALLRIKPATVREWTVQGRIVGVNVSASNHPNGRRLRYRRVEVQRLVNEIDSSGQH